MQDSTPHIHRTLQSIEAIYEINRNEELSEFLNSFDCDLSSLQPHITIAQQNIDRYIQLQSHLTHLQQTLSHLNLILLTPDGTIAQITPNAQILLQLYFPQADQASHPQPPIIPLPPVIQQWLQSKHPETIPLSVLSHDRCLIIRRLKSNLDSYLVLSEQAPIHLTSKSFQVLGLTARESEILFYVAQGHENQAIGDILNIHPTTVKTHLSNITEKLDVTSRLAAVTIALKKIGIEALSHQ